jgi:hypothetical protein
MATPVLRSGGCWPSAGAPGVSGAAQWLAFRSPPLPSLGLSSFVGGVITRYGSGLSSPKMTSVASTTNSPDLSIPIPARGQLVDSGGDILAIGRAACVVQRLGADERGPRGWQYAPAMIMLTLAVMVIARLPGRSVPGGFAPAWSQTQRPC